MNTAWQPTGNLDYLRARSKIIAKIRQFFAQRDVLEVETPILCQSTATDPPIASFVTHFHSIPTAAGQPFYLQTSPEFPMKRLLAAGIGAIYQMSKAFRNGESGRHHNPEFTLLEWYRPGFTHHELMDEVDDLLKFILNTQTSKRYTYAEIFEKYLKIDPHHCDLNMFSQLARSNNLDVIGLNEKSRDDWLNLLMSHLIEPQLIHPTFIYDYPASQAALAKIRNTTPRVAERFEVYVNGMELANGYHELSDSKEQHDRFLKDNQFRADNCLPQIPIDQRLIAALNHNFPECAGVALGLDRLVMLATGAATIAQVISFSLESA